MLKCRIVKNELEERKEPKNESERKYNSKKKNVRERKKEKVVSFK